MLLFWMFLVAAREFSIFAARVMRDMYLAGAVLLPATIIGLFSQETYAFSLCFMGLLLFFVFAERYMQSVADGYGKAVHKYGWSST